MIKNCGEVGNISCEYGSGIGMTIVLYRNSHALHKYVHIGLPPPYSLDCNQNMMRGLDNSEDIKYCIGLQCKEAGDNYVFYCILKYGAYYVPVLWSLQGYHNQLPLQLSRYQSITITITTTDLH